MSKAQEELLAIQTRNARWGVFAAALTAIAAIAGAVTVYLSSTASATQQATTTDVAEERPAQAPEPEPAAIPHTEPSKPIAEPSEPAPMPSPFDAEGWDSLRKQGDPWVLSQMASLNNMKVPAWAAKLPAENPYSFKLKICKDGSVDKVYSTGSTGNKDLDSAINGELQRLKLTKPPADIIAQMNTSCATLGHTFEWSQGKSR